MLTYYRFLMLPGLRYEVKLPFEGRAESQKCFRDVFMFFLGLVSLVFLCFCGKIAEAALPYETVGNGGYSLGNITVANDGCLWATSGDRLVRYNPINNAWSATPSVGFSINYGPIVEGNNIWVAYMNYATGDVAKIARWNGSSWWVLSAPTTVSRFPAGWVAMAVNSTGVMLAGYRSDNKDNLLTAFYKFSQGTWWDVRVREGFSDENCFVDVAASPTGNDFIINARERVECDGPDNFYFHQWKYSASTNTWTDLGEYRKDKPWAYPLVSTPSGLYTATFCDSANSDYISIGSSSIDFGDNGNNIHLGQYYLAGTGLENNKMYVVVGYKCFTWSSYAWRLYSFKLDSNLVEYLGDLPDQPQGVAIDISGNIWFTWNGSLHKILPLSAVPSPNGMTGQLVIKPLVYGVTPTTNMSLEINWGQGFYELGLISNATPTLSTVPQSTSCTIRLKRSWNWVSQKGTTIVTTQATTNTYTIPCIYLNPSVTATTGVKLWSQTRGYVWINLTWPGMVNASGYKIHIFDGNTYRTKNLGNVTSWDSRTAKIFPYPGDLPENNSISTDLFRWDGSGLDFEDTAVRLYRSTLSTSYDSDPKFYFRVTAYNQWMETNFNASSAIKVLTMPNATDSQQPTGSCNAASREGLKKTYDPNIKVSVSASDSGSGIWKVELSNDGVSYTEKYAAAKNADGGTSVSSYSNTFDWTVPLGAGTKVVYVRITDAVGNQKVVTDTVALAEDMLPPSVTLKINGGAESTTSPDVTLTLSVQDNASTTSQMQMRFSNDGNIWSPWEPFQQTKSWNITNASYGGTSSAGIKKVYAQVCDQAQNIALAVAEIGYNPTPPTGTVSIVGGTSGTWNGKPALFTKSDSPVLNLNYSGASQVRFDPGTGVWGDWESYATQKTVYLVKSKVPVACVCR